MQTTVASRVLLSPGAGLSGTRGRVPATIPPDRRTATGPVVLDRDLEQVRRYGVAMLLITLGILLLSAADAALTLNLISAGVVVEANPLMRTLIDYDVQAFALIKMLITGLCLVGLVGLAERPGNAGRMVHYALRGLLLVYGVVVAYEVIIVASLR